MKLQLRAAGADDQFRVGALHQRSRVAAYAGFIPVEVLTARSAESFGEWWAERWKWEQDTHRMTLAEVDGELAGFSYIGPSETPRAAELYAIHVDPARVGTGVGRELMVRALADLPAIGEARAVLWVLTENHPARRFYERGGWTTDGATRTEPVNDVPVPQVRYEHPL
ncbi:GCN5 family acetyltransferase [Actinoplanes sp. SE50]|uniref:GNAT family N-acetyltransferase n=1 Tax=unclassified Actinoplanes TaxID=2626549 RepID=UPI00023EC1E4|nr:MULTISPECIES: GNAT family N-acetyltransferase [unclassified Actinoplanes]AEV81852.1 GCN5-related N-acetyltransferase [Actinoplanes sp. SE50/110]ATO80253.1 GCN5 family acetyltransferase [Actinoplanes sp. SE50]SLL97658.1 GCN5 family acetyltransferase [Actinoplanes sp. SE50/110]